MKFVSILGDSISTYAGYNPEGYSVYYDSEIQKKNSLSSVYDTWWAMVNQALGAYLCVNNSYSGSRVSGAGFPAASSDERIARLRTDTSKPDIILIYIGFNDFGYGVKVRRKGLEALSGKDMLVFADAYDHMLAGIRERYPEAVIVCATLMRTGIRNKEDWIFPEAYAGINFEEYNSAIRKICKKQKCYLADMGSLNIRYETLDGSHPTARGHQAIAGAWIECLTKLGMIKPSGKISDI